MQARCAGLLRADVVGSQHPCSRDAPAWLRAEHGDTVHILPVHLLTSLHVIHDLHCWLPFFSQVLYRYPALAASDLTGGDAWDL